MQHLLIVNIGPVQEFIASARRSRDLWFGSWLLSELSKAAAKAIVGEEKNLESLIFPAPNESKDLEPDSSFDVANKIVAIIQAEPKMLATKLLNAVNARLNEIKEGAFEEIKGRFNRDVANKQIDDMLELFWVAKLIDKDYSQVRKEAEVLMAARKTTRNYTNVSWGSDEFKSSLDGQRESVIPKEIYKADPEKLWRKYRISEGERLCGVGLLKRLGKGKKGMNFYSTSHVASLPFIKLVTEKAEGVVNEYAKKLLDLGANPTDFGYSSSSAKIAFDGHILYEERLSDYFKKDEKDEKNGKTKLETAKEALKEFYEKLNKLNLKKRPSPYYGLLHADGDRMGEAIDCQKTAQAHQEISKALTKFAGSVRKIVEQDYNGCLVYAGGDDVLAFLPVDTILGCARKLSDDFKEKLKKFPTKSDSPTLSVGIAIVHHLDPLSDSLDLARKAEKAAKSIPNKNALAITVSKRSGTDLTVKGGWNQIDQRLEQWIAMHLNDQLPKGVAYELRDLALSLTDKNNQKSNEGTSDALIKGQVRRILERKRVNSASHPIDKNIIKEILHKMSNTNDEKGLSLKEISDEIIVAQAFADAKRLATPKQEGEE